MQTLRGITHAHSRYSFDGKMELGDLHELLSTRGYDFALMSEHIEELTADSMARFVSECALLSSKGCVLVPGIEIDDLHILIYGIRAAPTAWNSLTDLTEQFVEQGALIVISHPVKLHEALPALAESWAEGVEVWNTRYDGRTGPRLKSLQLYQARRKLKASTVAIGGVDLHSASDLSELHLEVSAQEATVDALLDAIRGGHFKIKNGSHEVKLSISRGAKLSLVLQTGFFDLAVKLNKTLKGIGIIVPKPLRKAIKKWI